MRKLYQRLVLLYLISALLFVLLFAASLYLRGRKENGYYLYQLLGAVDSNLEEAAGEYEEEIRHLSGEYTTYALAKTSSPLVATFDADMIPRRTFLMRTVPYFLIPEWKLGLLQTPQSFYNQDLFQFNLYAEKGIPNEQDFFSREINLLRNATNTAAYTGSNTVILREALEKCSCAIK